MRYLRLLTGLLLAATVASQAQSIVERRGALKVVGNKIVDQKDEPIQLTGMSFFWNQYPEGKIFYTNGVVNWLVSDWKCTVVRAAMGISTSGTYTNLPSINRVVESAIANGIYVIIDWHEELAVNHTEQSKAFFAKMAKKYGGYPNVIFEIYNEPNGTGTTWPKIKPYAEAVIDTIRQYSDNLVIVGTPQFSQRVDLASQSPIDPKYKNIAYTLHFYAGELPWHGVESNYLGGKLQTALDNGVAVFVTEWGTTDASGGQLTNEAEGAIFPTETDGWFNLLNANKISSCNWSISNKAEGASALTGSASVEGGWNVDTDLTPSGKFVRNLILSQCAKDSSVCPYVGTPAAPPVFPIPGKIIASQFFQAFGLETEPSTESNGGSQLTSVDSGDWANYAATANAVDTVEIRAKISTPSTGGTIFVRIKSATVEKEISILVPPSDNSIDWYWAQSLSRMPIPAGPFNVEIRFVGASKNLFKIQHLELVSNRLSVLPAPGPIALNRFSEAITRAGVLRAADDKEPYLAKMRTLGTATYMVNVAEAGSYTLVADAASGSNGGQLNVRVTGPTTWVTNSIAIPSTGGWDKWKSVSSTFAFEAGVSTVALTASGDTSALFSLGNMRIEAGTSVAPKSKGRGPSVAHTRGGLLVSLGNSQGYRHIQLIAADGRILSHSDISGLAEFRFPLPSSHALLWVRLVGSNTTTMAVPPML